MPHPASAKATPKPRPRSGPRVTIDTIRALALALPGVEEATSYGAPAFKIARRLLVWLRDDGETLVVRVQQDARDMLMHSDPDTFFITDHYANYPAVLVRLARVEPAAIAMILEESWRSLAPKRLIAARSTPVAKRPAAKRPAARGPAPTSLAVRPSATPGQALSRLRAICLALPGVTESEAHGRPCFAVRGKTIVMFMDNHHGDGRLAIWCKAPPGAQAMLVESAPARYFVPPYLGPRGWVGARLDGNVDWRAVTACVEEAHQMSAPRRAAARR